MNKTDEETGTTCVINRSTATQLAVFIKEDPGSNPAITCTGSYNYIQPVYIYVPVH